MRPTKSATSRHLRDSALQRLAAFEHRVEAAVGEAGHDREDRERDQQLDERESPVYGGRST